MSNEESKCEESKNEQSKNEQSKNEESIKEQSKNEESKLPIVKITNKPKFVLVSDSEVSESDMFKSKSSGSNQNKPPSVSSKSNNSSRNGPRLRRQIRVAEIGSIS